MWTKGWKMKKTIEETSDSGVIWSKIRTLFYIWGSKTSWEIWQRILKYEKMQMETKALKW